MHLNQFHKLISIIAVVVYILTAMCSHGYYHPDEHFQIIEFASFKLGATKADSLAWEYNAEIRPAIQPALCFIIFKVLYSVGFANPYLLAAMLRIITAMFAVTAIRFFTNATLPQIDVSNKRQYIVLSYFLWFLPFLNVRFSSEIWSGLFFLVAVAIVQKKSCTQIVHWILIGVFVGVSFLFRFQSIVLAMCLILWLVIVKKEALTNIFFILISALVMLQLGILIDYWFYGRYLYTFWNYFYVNIVLGVSSQFGILPWYYFLERVAKAALYPIGVIILFCAIVMAFRRWNSLIIWITIPFVLLHSLIPHKELRFLFPLINFIPFILISAWQEMSELQFVKKRISGKVRRCFLVCFATINSACIVIMIFRPNEVGKARITKYIYDTYGTKKINLICTNTSNPYSAAQLQKTFYITNNIRYTNLDRAVRSNASDLRDAKEINLLVLRHYEAVNPINENIINNFHFNKELQSMPQWARWINKYFPNFYDKEVLVLYSANKP